MRKMAIFFAFLLSATTGLAGDGKVAVEALGQWANVFGGTERSFQCAIQAANAFHGIAKWEFNVSGRTIARGEQQVIPAAGNPVMLDLKLAIPPVTDGVVMQAVLAVAVYRDGQENPAGKLEKKLWIFSDDPFHGRKEWLAQLSIGLFDPEKKTAEQLTESGVPFALIDNIDALGEGTGLILIGEGVSLKDYRGLAEALLNLASRGRVVLCLSLAGGEMLLPGMGDVDLPAPERLTFARHDVITALDKRLDAGTWDRDDMAAMASMKLKGERGPVSAEIVRGGSGWLWTEMNYEKRGRIIFCGFGIIDKWKSGPTARYLFASILEDMDKRGGLTIQTTKED